MSKPPSTILKVGSLIKQKSHQLEVILEKVSKIQKINSEFSACLEPHLQEYVYVMNVTPERLLIMTANSAIATQLRFQTPDLLEKIRKKAELKNIRYLQIKVSPTLASPLIQERQTLKSQKMALLSLSTSQIIKDTAKNLKDQKLSEILERIAAHCEGEEELVE